MDDTMLRFPNVVQLTLTALQQVYKIPAVTIKKPVIHPFELVLFTKTKGFALSHITRTMVHTFPTTEEQTYFLPFYRFQRKLCFYMNLLKKFRTPHK